ncbi:MAG TPA: hypothetical protein VH518_06585 [Tepidisphaeraceae bacterium]|jgi:hypothetical protein
MWISGRRAFRPDSQYYRNARKIGKPRSRPRKASAMTLIAALVVALVAMGVWWMIWHRGA